MLVMFRLFEMVLKLRLVMVLLGKFRWMVNVRFFGINLDKLCRFFLDKIFDFFLIENIYIKLFYF